MELIYQSRSGMAMKSIGIDIREANGFGAGKGRYAEEITQALIRQAPDVEFFLFTKEPNPRFKNSKNVHQVVIHGRSILWHLHLRRYLNHHPVDVFIAPTSYIYPAIAPRSQKIVTVVHDLIAFLHSKDHHWFPTLVERLTLKPAMKKTKLIVTVSNHTWRDLELQLPDVQNTAHLVVTPAIGENVHYVEDHRMQLPERFLLAVGTLLPRKNIQGVIKAFEQIAESKPKLNLVIAGGKGWKTSEIYKSIPAWLENRIHFLGYVPHHELMELYSRAQMLVFPSFYEGFGIPPLEAMACGCPVITSNVSSLPEAVGDAGVLIDPESTEELAEAILEMLGPQRQSLAKERAYKHVQSFSWDKSASLLLEQLLK